MGVGSILDDIWSLVFDNQFVFRFISWETNVPAHFAVSIVYSEISDSLFPD